MKLPKKIIARSASDKTDDWLFWYLAETNASLNITRQIAEKLGYIGFNSRSGWVFLNKKTCEILRDKWNFSKG